MSNTISIIKIKKFESNMKLLKKYGFLLEDGLNDEIHFITNDGIKLKMKVIYRIECDRNYIVSIVNKTTQKVDYYEMNTLGKADRLPIPIIKFGNISDILLQIPVNIITDVDEKKSEYKLSETKDNISANLSFVLSGDYELSFQKIVSVEKRYDNNDYKIHFDIRLAINKTIIAMKDCQKTMLEKLNKFNRLHVIEITLSCLLRNGDDYLCKCNKVNEKDDNFCFYFIIRKIELDSEDSIINDLNSIERLNSDIMRMI